MCVGGGGGGGGGGARTGERGEQDRENERINNLVL